jgi:hypothetical protein
LPQPGRESSGVVVWPPPFESFTVGGGGAGAGVGVDVGPDATVGGDGTLDGTDGGVATGG